MTSDRQKQSTFLRKSSQLSSHPGIDAGEPELDNTGSAATMNLNDDLKALRLDCEATGTTKVEFSDNFKYNQSANDFRFNFGAADEEGPSNVTSKTVDVAVEKHPQEPSLNFYKLPTSDNGFRFQFSSET